MCWICRWDVVIWLMVDHWVCCNFSAIFDTIYSHDLCDFILKKISQLLDFMILYIHYVVAGLQCSRTLQCSICTHDHNVNFPSQPTPIPLLSLWILLMTLSCRNDSVGTCFIPLPFPSVYICPCRFCIHFCETPHLLCQFLLFMTHGEGLPLHFIGLGTRSSHHQCNSIWWCMHSILAPAGITLWPRYG